MKVFFKFDNQDVVVVKGAESAAQAWEGAEQFLHETADNLSTGLAGSEGVEPLDNGSYEFRVKAY